MENESQKVEQFWNTPTHDQIVEISHAHVEALEASDDDNVWQQVGMHHIILTTKGRRTGKEHKCALPIWRDADGHRVVVGSFVGADREPDWLANLRDKTANGEVKTAIVMNKLNINIQDARYQISKYKGSLRATLKSKC